LRLSSRPERSTSRGQREAVGQRDLEQQFRARTAGKITLPACSRRATHGRASRHPFRMTGPPDLLTEGGSGAHSCSLVKPIYAPRVNSFLSLEAFQGYFKTRPSRERPAQKPKLPDNRQRERRASSTIRWSGKARNGAMQGRRLILVLAPVNHECQWRAKQPRRGPVNAGRPLHRPSLGQEPGAPRADSEVSRYFLLVSDNQLLSICSGEKCLILAITAPLRAEFLRGRWGLLIRINSVKETLLRGVSSLQPACLAGDLAHRMGFSGLPDRLSDARATKHAAPERRFPHLSAGPCGQHAGAAR
jgi:hypothetical protein